jgi:hypothetical protein
MATRWIENRPGVTAFLESGPVDHVMAGVAEKAASHARGIAPVGSPADDDRHPGAYRASIRTESTPTGPGYRVFASDQKAHWIEYGAAHMPRFQVLTRAVEAVRGNATMTETGG